MVGARARRLSIPRSDRLMAVLALAAVGAAIAPAGYAAIGWTIGMAVGNALFAKTQHITQEGPRLADLSVQTSTDGAPLMSMHGIARVAGNVIWSAGIKETRTDTDQDVGGKGGGGTTVTSTTYTYTCSFAVSLGKGPIISIRRIFADGKLMYSAVPNASVEDLQASSAILDLLEIYLGDETQLPSPTIEAVEGAGNVPGYRGQAYLVFRDLPLANFGNRIPNLTMEVVEAGSLAGPYKVLSKVPTAVAFANNSSTTNTPNIFGIDSGVVRIGVVGSVTVYLFDLCGNYLGTDTRRGDETLFLAAADKPVGYLGGCAVTYVLTNMNQPISGGDLVRVSQVSAFATWKIADLTDPLPDAEYFGGVSLCADGRHAMVYTSPTDATLGGNVINKWYLVAFDGSAVSLIDSGTLQSLKSIYDFRFGAASTQNFGVSHLEGSLRHVWTAYGASDRPVRRYEIGADKVMRDVFSYTPMAGIFSHPSIFSDNGIAIVVSYNEIAVFTRMPSAPPASVPLSTVVSEICQSAGLLVGDINVSALTGTVDGYVLTQPMTARAALEPLMRAYYFDAVESGNVIKFVPRGGASAKTVPVADLAAHADGEALPDAISVDRVQERELPREVVVLYMDAAADYQQGSQSARRLVTQGRDSVTGELPMVLTADRARQIAEVLLTDAWMARRAYPVSLPPKYIDLEPTDVVTLSDTNATHTVRIIDQEIGANGVIRCQAVAESAAVYTSTAVGAQADITPQALSVIGPTNLQLLDIPILRDQDDVSGYYLAAAGYLSSWRGAVIEHSRDGGEAWTAIGSKLTAAVMGVATNALATGSTRLWDHASSGNVRTPIGTLSSSTEDGVLGGANLALLGVHGRWELLQFRDAVLQADGTWPLSHFLRGVFGTEYAVDKHAVGDVFVLFFSSSLLCLVLVLLVVGLSLKYHALSIGAPAYTPVAVDFANTDLAQRPYSVAQLAGIKQSNGDWLIQWQARVRKGQSWMQVASIAADAAITGYQVDIMSGSTVKRSLLITSGTSYTYALEDQGAEFGAGQATLTDRVYAYNQQIGQGYGVEITAPDQAETYRAPSIFTGHTPSAVGIRTGLVAGSVVITMPPLTDMFFDGTSFRAISITANAGFYLTGSGDALTWTRMANLLINAEFGVKAGSYYFWGNSLGAIVRATTGADGSWTAYQRSAHPLRNLGNVPINDMASDGTRLVAVGANGLVESTTDGVTWVEEGVGVLPNTLNLVFIAYLNGYYFTAGAPQLTPNDYNQVYRSSDRNAWTNINPSAVNIHRINGMAYGGGVLVAVGWQRNLYGTLTPALIYSTNNGTSWSQATRSGALPGTYFMGIVHNGSRFVAVGRKCYAYSTDGVTWTFVQDSVANMCIARNGSLMVSSVVETGCDPAAWLQSTTDGITWSVIQ